MEDAGGIMYLRTAADCTSADERIRATRNAHVRQVFVAEAKEVL
jgi:hypothetical protein